MLSLSHGQWPWFKLVAVTARARVTASRVSSVIAPHIPKCFLDDAHHAKHDFMCYLLRDRASYGSLGEQNDSGQGSGLRTHHASVVLVVAEGVSDSKESTLAYIYFMRYAFSHLLLHASLSNLIVISVWLSGVLFS